MPQFPAVVSLSVLDGSNGFQINGESSYDNSGIAVFSAGDVNGDGFSDLLIGASGASVNGLNSGASYVVFGKASGFGANLSLSGLNGANGFQINGVAAGDISGYSVASGDINRDGFSDLIIGAPDADPNGLSSGTTYVLFGKASGFGATTDLSTLNGTNGFRITGELTSDGSGAWVSAGDINGDGFADVIIGASGADPNGTYSGATYVVFGKASGFAASIALSTLDGTNGFQINGESDYDLSGFAVSSAGDVNGDGFADIIIGAYGVYNAGLHGGAAYVVFGKASGFTANLELASLNGANGFQITSEAAYDFTGFAVSTAGDINGDGFDDLIIGAYGVSAGGAYAGASYIVFGKASGFAADFSPSALNGSNGFRILGEVAYDYSGFAVSSAGDVNGDGFDDLLIGAPFATVNGVESGTSYVVFGKASGFTADLDLLTLDGTNGFYIDGESSYDSSGFAVSSAGDVNGDGFADLIIGAPYASPNGLYSGASYVVFGRLPDFSVNRTGTAAAQTLAGGNLNDTLSGLAGNDKLYGHGGNDVLDGGSGADCMYGGTGNDTFYVDGQPDLVFENPGEGSDTVIASTNFYLYDNIEALTLAAGAGDIFGSANALSNTITGNEGANLLLGWDGNDTIFGGAGNDVIYGVNGNDVLNGELGLDALIGGDGGDTLDGGSAPDALYGENGNDVLYGGTGFDTDILVGGNGNDVLDGSASIASGQPRNQGDFDRFYGGLGDDTYYVDTPADLTFEFGNLAEGNDTVYADIVGAGYYLYGSTENLILLGSTPFGVGNELDNMLIGNAASNWLLGGLGNDTLNGKAGNDALFGEGGADTFVFERGTGGDNVADFVKGQDKIKLVAVGFSSYADLTAHNNLFENAGSSVIDLGLGDFVVVTGVTGLTANDFIFA